MKAIVFIFIPVVIERAEIQIAVRGEQRNEQPIMRNEAVRDEVYPFWTWFIDNPRPKTSK